MATDHLRINGISRDTLKERELWAANMHSGNVRQKDPMTVWRPVPATMCPREVRIFGLSKRETASHCRLLGIFKNLDRKPSHSMGDVCVLMCWAKVKSGWSEIGASACDFPWVASGRFQFFVGFVRSSLVSNPVRRQGLCRRKDWATVSEWYG